MRSLTSVFAAGALALSLVGAVDPVHANGAKQKRCTSPPASQGPAWQELVSQDGAVKGVFYTDNNCPVNYNPVSGGVRYEGAWNDPSIAFKWKEIASIPYDDALPDQEAKAWRCMVIRTPEAGKDERPYALWCQAVCCRWD